MAEFTWGGLSGSWTDPSQWTSKTVPSPGDTAFFPSASSPYQATVTSPVAIDSVTVDSGNSSFPTLNVESGGMLTLTGTLDIQSGQVEAGDNGTIAGGIIEFDAGGTLIADDGTISGSTIETNGGSVVLDFGTLSNDTIDGPLVLSAASPSTFQFGYVTNGLTLTGADGTGPGELELATNDASLELDSGTVSLGSPEAPGTIDLSSPSTDLSVEGATLTNVGTITLARPFSSLNLDSGTLSNVGTIDLSGTQTTVDFAGTVLSNIGTLDIGGTGSSARFEGDSYVNGLTINLGSPTATGPGSPPSLVEVNEDNSSLTLGPDTVINHTGPTGEIAYERSVEAAVARPAITLSPSPPSPSPVGIVNQGQINAGVSGGLLVIDGPFTNEGAITVSNGDTLALSPFSTFTNSATGTVTVTGATVTENADVFDNSGTIDIDAGGKFDVEGPLSPSPTAGPIDIATGGTLELQTSPLTLAELDGSGIANHGGIVEINGALDLEGQTLDVGMGTALGAAELGPLGEISDGTIVDHGNEMTFAGGILDNVTYSHSPDGTASPVALTGSESLATEDFTGPVVLSAGTSLTIYGDPNNDDAILPADWSNVQNSGGLVVFNNGTISNATLDIGSGTALGTVFFDNGLTVSDSTIDDSGNTTGFFGATFDDVTYGPGPIMIGSGESLKVDNLADGTAIDVTAGGELELTGNITLAELETIDNTGGTVFLDGYLELGSPAAGSPPTLGSLNLADYNLGAVVLDFNGTIADGAISDPDRELEFAGGTLRDATYGPSPITLAASPVPSLTSPTAVAGSIPVSHVRMVGWTAEQNVTIAGGELDLFGPSPDAPADSVALDITETGGSLQLNGFIGTGALADTTNSGGQILEFGTLDNANQTLTLGTETTLGSLQLQSDGEIQGGTIVDQGNGLTFASFSYGSVLDGVTYQSAGALSIPDSVLYVNNGLTLKNAAGTGGGALDLEGGDLYVAGNLTGGTAGSPVTISVTSNAQIFFGNTTTLDNAALTVSGATFYIEPFTISPANHSSSIVALIDFLYLPANSPSNPSASPIPVPDMLTLGPDAAITATGALDFLSPATDSGVVNEGTVTEGTGSRVTGNFTNAGTLNINASPAATASNGAFVNTGTLNIGEFDTFSVLAQGSSPHPTSFSNTGTINVASDGALVIGSAGPNLASESNAGGTINLSPTSFLLLYGDLTTADLGTIRQVASPNSGSEESAAIELHGDLDNTGATLDLGDNTSGQLQGLLQLQLWGGTITGGTIHDAGLGVFGPGLFDDIQGGTLDGVIYQGTLDLGDYGETGPLNIADGLTVETLSGASPGTIDLTGISKVLNFEGTQTLDNVTIDIGTLFTAYSPDGDTIESTGGTLTLGAAATLDVQGYFAGLAGTGAIIEQGALDAGFTNGRVTIDPGSFTEAGTITVSNGTQLAIEPTDFTNFAGGTLTGGVYVIDPGSTLQLASGDAITALDADLTLSGTGAAVFAGTTSIQASLASIGAAGVLRLLDGASYTTANTIVDTGRLQLDGSLAAGGLTISPTGTLDGSGTVSGLENDGTITASGGTLDITGPITGTAGQLDIGSATNSELEIGSTTAETVSFGSHLGVLKLDDPAGFAGRITGLVTGDVIDLGNTTVTGINLSPGSLTVDTTDGTLSYDVSGELSGSVFSPSPDGAQGTQLVLGQASTSGLATATIIGDTTITLPNVHVNATSDGAVVEIENSAAPGSGGLDARVESVTGNIAAFGTITDLAPGAPPSAITIASPAATAGTIAGTVVLDFSSDNSGTITPLPSQTLTVTGSVYRLATPSITAPSPLFVHVGDDDVAEQLTIVNTATDDGYSENLLATAGTASPASGFTVSGSTGDIAPGDSSDAITLNVPTAVAGVFSIPVSVNLESDGTGIDGLGETSLGTTAVTANVTVDNMADPEFNKIVAAGTSAGILMKVSPTSYTYDLGVADSVTGPIILDFDVLNAALAPADDLDGSFTISPTASVSASPPLDSPLPNEVTAGIFTNSGFSPFANVGAGDTTGELQVTFDPAAAATKVGPNAVLEETITLKPTDSNPDYSGTLSPITLQIKGAVSPPSPTQAPEIDADDVDFQNIHTVMASYPSGPQTLTKPITVQNSGHADDPWLDVSVAGFTGPAKSVTGGPIIDLMPPDGSDSSIQIALPSPVNLKAGEFDGTVYLAGAAVYGSNHNLVSPLPDYKEVDYKGTVYEYAKPTLTDSYGDAIDTDGKVGTTSLNLGTIIQGSSPVTISFYIANDADSKYGDKVQITPSVTQSSSDFQSSLTPTSPVAGGASGVSVGYVTFMPTQTGTQTFTVNLHDENVSTVQGFTGQLPDDPVFTITANVTSGTLPLPPPPPPAPPPGSPPGPPHKPPSSPNVTDVHITTFDGLYYNFQGAGEFVAAKSTNPADTFEVQYRLQPYFIGAAVSVITAIATQVGSDVVEFDLAKEQSGQGLVWVDNQAVELDATNSVLELPGGGGKVTYDGFGNYTVDYATGEVLRVGDEGALLNAFIQLSPGAGPGSVEGLDGTDSANQNDDLVFGPNLSGAQAGDIGAALPQPIASALLYGEYANSWRVSPATTLFNYSPGQDTAFFTDENFPTNPLSIDQLPASILAKATELAQAAGITNPTLLQDAILDYAETGNIAFITDLANLQQQQGDQGGSVTTASIVSPTPAVVAGLVAAQGRVTEVAGHTNVVQFAVDLNAAAPSPLTFGYTVTAPDGGYLDKGDFDASSPPAGSVTVAAGATTAAIDITVPQGVLGTAASKLLQIQLSPVAGVTLATPVAQTEIDNSQPEPGSNPAQIGLELVSGGGTLNSTGSNAWTLDLGEVARGATLSPSELAAVNAATAPADNLSGSAQLGSGSTGFTNVLGGFTALIPGQIGDAALVGADTSTDGIFTETLDFTADDVNNSGYSAALPTQTVTVTLEVDPSAPQNLAVAGQPVNGNPVTVTGTGEAGDTLTLYNGTSVVGSGSVGNDGSFSVATTGNFADGTYTLTATETDTAGLTSALSAGLLVNVGAPTGKNWTGSTSADWLTAGNWNPAAVPASSDDVIIGTTANFPTLSNATVAVNSITLSGTDTLTLSGAGIDVANGVSFTSNGRILAQGAGAELNGAITDSAGTGASLETASGTFEVTGQIADNTGGLILTIDNNAKLVLDAAGNAHQLVFTDPSSELDLKSGLTLGSGLSNNGKVVLLNPGSSLTDTAGITLTGGSISGQGKITGPVSGSGTVAANGGTLELVNALGASTGTTFAIDASSVLLLDQTPGAGNTYSFQGITGTLALADDIGFSGTIADMNVGSNGAVTTAIDIKGHAVSIASESGQGSTTGSITLSDGAVLNLASISSPEWLAKTSSDGNGGTDVYLLNEPPPPGATNPGTFPQTNWQLASLGDFNGDGFADLLWFAPSMDVAELEFTRDDSTLGGGPIANNPFVNNWNLLASGDFNGDGTSDLVWQQQGTGITEIQAFRGGVPIGGGAIVGNPFGADWTVAGVGDFNGDGDSDLVWQQQGTGLTEIELLRGISIIGGGAIPNNPFGLDWKVAGVGDFNGDGRSDLVWQQQGTGLVELQFLNGNQPVGGGQIIGNPFGADWNVVGTGDFNGDGKSDLVWQQQGTGLTEIEFLNSNFVVGGGAIPNNPFTAGWKVAGVGDFNGDGKPDLVYQNSSLGLTEVQWLNGLTPLGGGLITFT